MTQKIFGFFFFFVLSHIPDLRAQIHWQNPHWLKLLHYQKQWTGSYVSQADGKDFFLSVNGKFSPKDELASLLLSLETEELDEHKNSFCRFPARVRWLKKVGYALPQNKIECRNLEEFKQRVSARSAYIVFSSYFLDNPVSSFGHTFMRLGKTEFPDPSYELMDTGVSYAAETGSAGFISYVFKGLTGGFPGEFRATPYYTKVHEYNNSEMRDLWSYQLDLTQEEIHFLVDHLWELSRNHFDYFFMTENCSYHMLTLLEAVRPELKLVERLPDFYVLPSDTLKVIKKERLIKSISFRPSPERVSIQMSKLLPKKELEMIPNVIEAPSLAKKYSDIKAATLLDAALLQLDISKEKELLVKHPKTIRLQRDLMLTRSKIPIRSPKLNYDDLLANAPHDGHGSRRFKMGSLSRNNKTWSTFGFRGALHDIMDNETSYLPKTSLEMLEVVARSDGHRFQIEEYTLLNLLNLREITETKKTLSWKAGVGGWRDYFKAKEREKIGFSGGVGASKTSGSLTGYIFPVLETAYISYPEVAIYAGTGLDLGIFYNISHLVRAHSMLGIRDERWNESFFQNELRFSSLRYGVGVVSTYSLLTKHQEFQLAGYFYF